MPNWGFALAIVVLVGIILVCTISRSDRFLMQLLGIGLMVVLAVIVWWYLAHGRL